MPDFSPRIGKKRAEKLYSPPFQQQNTLCAYFRYLSNHPKNSLFQTNEFCGLKT